MALRLCLGPEAERLFATGAAKSPRFTGWRDVPASPTHGGIYMQIRPYGVV